MHGRRSSGAALVQAICARTDEFAGVDLWVAPPAVYLAQISGLISGRGIGLVAQNVARELDGAFTGEVSAGMLADVGCLGVLVGHSERRSRYGEPDAVIAEKFGRAQDAGLIPVLCVGETLEERESGRTEEVVLSQLAAVVASFGVSALSRSIIAYEPVWAIGTGRTATPEQAQLVHAVLRADVAARSLELADDLRIIYGGSVKAANAPALFGMPDVDGALVGGASLDADEFVAIARAAAGHC
jgi:triosephosphate isomerase